MTILYIIIGATVLMSMKGFNDRSFFEKYLFDSRSILASKEWYRTLSSGLLHANWTHLLFNMYALYTFSEMLLFQYFTEVEFLALYVLSLLAGSALSLYIHRNHSYRAIGASGAVSGVIYASIALDPNGGIGLIFLPGLWIPSWIFGLIFIAYSIFGIRSQRDNIGHEAHLGGAIGGLILTVLYFNNTVDFNYWVIAGILIPTLIFLYIVIRHPEWLLTGKANQRFKPMYPAKRKSGEKQSLSEDRQRELNRLLDKVNRLGYEGLSLGERRRLDELSNNLKD